MSQGADFVGEILSMSYIPSDSYNLSSPPFTGSPELEGRDPVEAIYLLFIMSVWLPLHPLSFGAGERLFDND